ncbi:hypothetical protein [Nitratifractor sp.]|uniref:hypothetical protein n=1 Tax=Nitratifractor sp. TaxID=2268144 RepID=UPI0025FBDDB0|nr:hypothetical protein [Nitratifractor sp.]
MFTVNVEKECSCFRKSDMKNSQIFESKDQALMQAQKMAQKMNEEFCQKHNFSVVETGEHFTIRVEENRPAGGCCGGGHCG